MKLPEVSMFPSMVKVQGLGESLRLSVSGLGLRISDVGLRI